MSNMTIAVTRDRSHRAGRGACRLCVILELGGGLTDLRRQQLIAVAEKCPVHELMTQATTEIRTELAPR
jgi:putative redox protein